MVKDYDGEILYHPDKANVVEDALSRKTTSTPVQDLCLRMTVISGFPDMISDAKIERIKKENWKKEKTRVILLPLSRTVGDY